jgi:hypothetical protein
VARHVDRHAGDGRGEVGSVIQIEAAEKVLIGFPFTAMLRDDHARHGFEHFTVTHQRPLVELFRRDRPLARGLRDPHEVLGRVLDVRQIGESPLTSHGHVRRQREMHHDVETGRAGWADVDLPPHAREVDQREDRLPTVGFDVLEAECASSVSDRQTRSASRGTNLH